MTFTSLSTKTGQPYRPKALGIGWSCQPGMIGGCDGRPVENSTGPGTPTPTAHTSAGVSPASASTSWASRSTSASTAGAVGDVDRVPDRGEDLARTGR